MSQWRRVFGRGVEPPAPALLLEELQRCGLAVTAEVQTDEQGWITIRLQPTQATTPVLVERFLVSEKGIRSELNSWAAWLETCAPREHASALMERMIQTQQLFTFQQPAESSDFGATQKLCTMLCTWLAQHSDGVYQIDEQGFFAADGTLLVPE